MSVATMTGNDAALAAPVDAMPVDPAALLARRVNAQVALLTPVSSRHLKVSVRQFRGREVPDPAQQQARRLADADVAGRLAQTQALVIAHPESNVAASRHAQNLLLSGQAEEAALAARSALALPRQESAASDAALFIAARVLASTESFDEAESALDSLPSTGPWTLLYASLAERRGDFGVAIERLGDVETPEGLSYLGYLLLRLGRPQEALRILRRSARLAGPDPSLLLNQAYAFAVLGSTRKAVKAARQAVALAPRSLNASFNLAAYLRIAGELAEADLELRRVESLVGASSSTAAARADLLLSQGRARDAAKLLRRATHHTDEPRDSLSQAELLANLAVLDWVKGDLKRSECWSTVRSQVEAVGPQLSLSVLLADLVRDSSEVPAIEHLYERLSPDLSQEDLLPLAARLAYLQGQYVESARISVRWAAASPLDVHAARVATVQVGQYLGDYDAAARIGLESMRRLPRDAMLTNNVAFVLALAGRAEEADLVLSRTSDVNPFLTATRGLVDFALGRIESGLRHYNAAEQEARRRPTSVEQAETFSALLRVQRALGIFQLGLQDHPAIPADLKTVQLPDGWNRDPRFNALAWIAHVQGSPWPKC